MTFKSLAFRKGRELARSNLRCSRQRTLCASRHASQFSSQKSRFSTSVSFSEETLPEEHTARHIQETVLERRSAKEKASDRDFYLSILTSTSTKREAKSYLQHFKPIKKLSPERPKTATIPDSDRREQSYYDPSAENRYGVNLGSFYVPAKAVDASPVFVQGPLPDIVTHDGVEPLHVALVKIRGPQLLDTETLQGIGQTLAQLGRLGLSSVVVIDCDGQIPSRDQTRDHYSWRRFVVEQADRVVTGIESNPGPGARRLDSIISVAPASDKLVPKASHHSVVRICFRELLLAPLKRGVIPVVAPVGFTAEQISVPVCPNEVMHALTVELAGLLPSPSPDEEPERVARRVDLLQRQVSLDRLIILDPLGGIPSQDRPGGSHVYINMEQEFEDIRNQLLRSNEADSAPLTRTPDSASSTYVEKGVGNNDTDRSSNNLEDDTANDAASNFAHIRNLDLLNRTLSLLPPTSSGILTTPVEAANSGRPSSAPFKASGVGTRRMRNPLIHNLLTDKPAISSSLPTSRLGPKSQLNSSSSSGANAATTFIKRGMPLTIVPDPRTSPWTPPDLKTPILTLNDPRIDLPRLIHLIEDSFDRKLDVEHYLSRANSRIAGLIIAGEYEGGALLTWETPFGVDGDGSEAGRQRLVPYLDKFAVLKRSQGAGGVADIVFTAMVHGCFPQGVCWRSRRDNPVNKWYFERARGTWKIPNSNWTMFWTTENITANPQTFLDYESVCRSVLPSWADKKAVVD